MAPHLPVKIVGIRPGDPAPKGGRIHVQSHLSERSGASCVTLQAPL